MVTPILRGEADLVLGSRLAEPGMARAGGMPLYKYLANRALTTVENRLLGTHLTEMHTGYRAYSRGLLLEVPFLRNALDFSFDSEMLMQSIHLGFRVAEVPARTRYFADASSISLRPSVDLRDQDLVGRGPPGAASQRHPAVPQVRAVSTAAPGALRLVRASLRRSGTAAAGAPPLP